MVNPTLNDKAIMHRRMFNAIAGATLFFLLITIGIAINTGTSSHLSIVTSAILAIVISLICGLSVGGTLAFALWKKYKQIGNAVTLLDVFAKGMQIEKVKQVHAITTKAQYTQKEIDNLEKEVKIAIIWQIIMFLATIFWFIIFFPIGIILLIEVIWGAFDIRKKKEEIKQKRREFEMMNLK